MILHPEARIIPELPQNYIGPPIVAGRTFGSRHMVVYRGPDVAVTCVSQNSVYIAHVCRAVFCLPPPLSSSLYTVLFVAVLYIT
jgi:hypothetical protein